VSVVTPAAHRLAGHIAVVWDAFRHSLAAIVWAAGRAPLLTALALAATVATVALAGLPVFLLTRGTTAAAHGHWGFAARDLIGYALVGPVVGSTLGRAWNWIHGRLNLAITVEAQAELARALADLPYEAFEGGPLQGRVGRAREGLSALEGAVGLGLSLASTVAGVASVAAVLGHLSTTLALAACAAPLVALLARYHSWAVSDAFYRWWAERQRSEAYHEGLLLDAGAVKELRAFGAEPWVFGRWRAGRTGRQEQETAIQERASIQAGVVEVLRVGVYMGAMGACVAAVLAGRLPAGALTGTVDGLQRVQGSMSGLMGTVIDMLTGGARAGDLFTFLRGAHPARARRIGGRPLREDWAEIRLEGVGYTYPGRITPVLRDVNLVIRRGCITALVGLNGAGKTTVLKLLTGLLEPREGRVTIGGTDLRDLDLSGYWRRLAVLFQGGPRYQLPLRDCVGLARWADGECSDAEVRDALARSGLDGSLDLDRLIGRDFAEDGIGLSGGQWQRLELARVYGQRAAEVVILDEPSSALDPDAEAALYREFRAAIAGTGSVPRTGLLVSHRLGPVRHADHIIVLDGQSVAEQGTHEVLLAKGGLYARMFQEQQALYA